MQTWTSEFGSRWELEPSWFGSRAWCCGWPCWAGDDLQCLSKLPRRSQTQTLHGVLAAVTPVWANCQSRQPAPCPPPALSDEDAREEQDRDILMRFLQQHGRLGIGLLVVKIHRAWELTIYPLVSSPSHCLHWPSIALQWTLLWPSLDRWSMLCPSDTELQRKVTPAPRRAGLGFKKSGPHSHISQQYKQCLPSCIKNQAELPPDRRWLII